MAIEKIGNDGFIATGEHVQIARLLALRGALSLECHGLKGRVNAAKLVREILKAANYSAPRKKTSLLGCYELYLRKQGYIK